ncbi:1-phosphofructokinase family hexose kinase [Agromyces silvae]|uniref:1-phosphofructokinase family hexose kinase n=1 Tax=Agromyces silvae TaxID=3388266 RepID=UPI00280B495B|nr:hexose kinase [Agromyces protaetiae]
MNVPARQTGPRILTVTPNPAIDITYTVGRQTLGETVRVADVRRRPGGKGLNVARVLRTLGRDATSLQPLGGDAGDWIARTLAADGIPVAPCRIAGETRTTVAIVDGIAHPTLFAEPGPRVTAREWAGLCETVSRNAGPGDWVVVAGSFPPGIAATDVGALILAARSRGARVVVDTSGPPLLAAAAAGAAIVKANEQEMRDAVGGTDTHEALAQLGRHGSDVVVSRGSRGAAMRLADGTVHEQIAVPGVHGNPTGAGDAATAGLVAALADGRDPIIALRWAAVCGAAAVLSAVAGELDPALLPELGTRIGLAADSSPLPAGPERSPS